MSSSMAPGLHPVLAALADIDAGLDALTEGNMWSLLDSEALAVRVQLEGLASRLTGQKLRSTREVDIRGAAVAAGASSLREWLVNVVRLPVGEATREARLAGLVTEDLPATNAALCAGMITPAAVAVIADSDLGLAKFATAAERSEAEEFLAAQAQVLPVRGLQNVAMHLANRLDPDQGDRLAKAEQEQVAARVFRLRMGPDGSCRPSGYLDKEATAFLRAALDPLAKPRPAADGIRDERSPAARMGDALVELVELALRSGQLPTQAGQPVQVVVTIPLAELQSRPPAVQPGNDLAGSRGDQWGQFRGSEFALRRRSGAGVGMLDTGIALSAAATRRWACDCQLIPMVLGAHGEPLDAGRASRTATPAIRRALDARDNGCVFPGCDRPVRWTVAHHIWHWEDGGPTEIGNLVLVCGHHHRVVHHQGWDVAIDTDGLPTFYPPAWIDPDRTPRRHHRLRPVPARPSDHTQPGKPGARGAHDLNAPVIPYPRRT